MISAIWLFKFKFINTKVLLNKQHILQLFLSLTIFPLYFVSFTISLNPKTKEGPQWDSKSQKESEALTDFIFFSAWEAVMDLMSESEMAALIKLVWLAEIGSLLLGKENRKTLHKQS